jgi:hypothetical protein
VVELVAAAPHFRIDLAPTVASDRLQHAALLADAVNLDMTAWFTPTAANYFGKISKSRIIDALREVKGSVAPAGTGMKKSELAALAERQVAGTGWLPEPLRYPAPCPFGKPAQAHHRRLSLSPFHTNERSQCDTCRDVSASSIVKKLGRWGRACGGSRIKIRTKGSRPVTPPLGSMIISTGIAQTQIHRVLVQCITNVGYKRKTLCGSLSK